MGKNLGTIFILVLMMYATVKIVAAYTSNCIMNKLANSVKAKAIAMLTQSQTYENRKCEETIYEQPHVGYDIARYSFEKRREQLSVTSWVDSSAPHSRNWMLKNLANSAKAKAEIAKLMPNQTSFNKRKCVEHIYETPHVGDDMCRTSCESGVNMKRELHSRNDRTKMLSPIGAIL